MTTLNLWKATWSLDEAQCPCDIHFLEYLEEKGVRGAAIFHFGTGNHHILGLKTAQNGSNNAVLGITASTHEYQAYIDLLVANPHLGHTYKAYFGDIYQIDARLLRSIPAGRYGEPRELAAVITFLASAPAAYLTGTTIAVDGGYVRGVM